LVVAGQTEAGIAHLRQGASLAPKSYGPVWEHLGLAYQKQGRHQLAVKAFEKATQLMPAFPQPWLHLSQEYLALGRVEDAKRAAAHARSVPSSTKQKKL
jgi:Flp pilus assembly protein TadD